MTVDTGWAPRSFAFGPFVLVPERQSLREGESSVRIGGRALDLLTALVERPGEVISKRQLMARAWPDVVVDEGNLKVNMAALRRALGDESTGAQYIATVTGRGYRFVAPVHANGVPAAANAVPAPEARRHNLPVRTTHIVGRADAIDGILRDLTVARLVSVVGPGGIGKTTVALAAAAEAGGLFQHGVWQVDLARLKRSDELLNGMVAAIAAATGLPGNAAGSMASLCEALRHREMLLVLDGCEHLIEAAAACANQLLHAASGVRVLATSREPLMVNGERVRRLAGLGGPLPSSALTAKEALDCPAVQLFVARATDGVDSFRLGDADAREVVALCRSLDGLPLAIELAATRVETFGVSGLRSQLEDRLLLLLTGRRAGPARHRTLAATIDWSFDLLSVREVALLCAVSAFVGPFDSADAAHMADLPVAEAEDTLVQLTAKSLMANAIGPHGISYRLLQTVRIYCLERLRADGQLRAARLRHAERVCDALREASALRSPQPPAAWSANSDRLIDELQSALAWASRPDGDASLRTRLAQCGAMLWRQPGGDAAGPRALPGLTLVQCTGVTPLSGGCRDEAEGPLASRPASSTSPC